MRATLAAELAFVDAELSLVFLGVSVLLVGSIELSGFEIAVWGQWPVFAGLSIGSLVGFRQRIYVLMRPPADEEIPEASTATLPPSSKRSKEGADSRRATPYQLPWIARGARWPERARAGGRGCGISACVNHFTVRVRHPP